MQAADRITATISVTNAPIGSTNKITINADTRSFTNSVTGAPASLIQETNSIPWTATNLLQQLSAYRVSQFHFLGQSASTNVRVIGSVGEALTVTLAGGWGYVTYTTQTVSSPTFVVRVPMTVEPTSNRTEIASLLVKGQSDNSTNSFATNAIALSNYITKGASPVQSIASELRVAGNINNGVSSLSVSNLENFGNAIRSFGAGGNSFQAGSNATATAARSVAIGNSSSASATDALAVGTSAQATNSSATAVGVSAASGQLSTAIGASADASANAATAVGNGSQAIGSGSGAFGQGTISSAAGSFAAGQNSTASADYAIAIGNENTDASGTNAVAIGFNAAATAYRATALGPGASASLPHSSAIGGYDTAGTATTATETNQIRLGTAIQKVSVPGILEVDSVAKLASITNAALRGTNIINARLDLTRRDNTGLANGNNAGVILGTNVYVKLSGPSATYTINGIAAGQDGTFHIVELDNPVASITIAHESGTDPTAANRINTGTGANVTITNNPAFIQVIYSTAASRWRVINYSR